MICRNFRRRIEAAGGAYRFDCRFEGLDVVDGRVRVIIAHRNPGLADTNWLDTAGHERGVWTLRWLEAKQESNFELFAPHLEEVVALTR